MNAYKLFKYCMGCAEKPYSKTEEEFNESEFFKFFYALSKHFKSVLKFNDVKTKQYISVCAKIHGSNFSPWKLNTTEYMEAFASWYKINSSLDTYMRSVKESIHTIVNFCKKKKIRKIEDYIKNWGVTHYISGILNDNVAYAMGLHEVNLAKPEKFMIKKFLKNVPMIKERIEREGRLNILLEAEIKQAKEMLIWIPEEV